MAEVMNLVRVALVSDLGVAMVINALLESEGCFTLDSGGGHLSRSGANQGCYITVAEEDVSKAVVILQSRGFESCILIKNEGEVI